MPSSDHYERELLISKRSVRTTVVPTGSLEDASRLLHPCPDAQDARVAAPDARDRVEDPLLVTHARTTSLLEAVAGARSV
jgi:hypothetical protein